MMKTGYYSATFRRGKIIHHWVCRNILDDPESFFRNVAEEGGVIPLSFQEYTLFGIRNKPFPKFTVSTRRQCKIDNAAMYVEKGNTILVRFCGMDNNFIYYVGYDC